MYAMACCTLAIESIRRKSSCRACCRVEEPAMNAAKISFGRDGDEDDEDKEVADAKDEDEYSSSCSCAGSDTNQMSFFQT